MTIELSNLPFQHNELDELGDNIDMEALAFQLNAIEPGAGAHSNLQETATSFAPHIAGLDSSVTIMAIAGLAVLSIIAVSIVKYTPKHRKVVK